MSSNLVRTDKPLIAFVVFLLSSLSSNAQSNPFSWVSTWPIKAHGIEIDKLGNIYTFYDEKVDKLGSDGKPIKTDSFKKYGAIHSMDVSNPLKIMVYFEELLQIVFLDNELGVRGSPVELDFLGYPQTVAACLSYDNGIWLFDKSTFQLTRLDENLRETNSTSNLMQVIGSDINPLKLFESNRRLYLTDPDEGVFIFDFYGTFSRKIPVKGILSIDFFGRNVYFQTAEQLFVYDEEYGEMTAFELPIKNSTYLAVHKNKIYLLSQNDLHIFNVNL